MPATAMLISIWNSLMMKIQSRSTKSHKTTRITNHALEYLMEQTGEAGKYTAVNSSSNVVMVQAPNGDSHIVKLNEGTCTCLEFQDRKLPCQHAIRACQEFNLEPEAYVAEMYEIDTYRSTYETFMPPICMEDLCRSSDCLAPPICRRSGRQKKKRQEKKRKKNSRMVRCSLCRSTDHNRRNCHQDIWPERGLRDSDNEDETSQSSSTESSSTESNTSEVTFTGFSESSFAGFSDHDDNAFFSTENNLLLASNTSLSTNNVSSSTSDTSPSASKTSSSASDTSSSASDTSSSAGMSNQAI